VEKPPRYWKPLKLLRPSEMFRRREVVEETAAHYKISFEEAEAKLDADVADKLYFVNNLYQVEASQCGPGNTITHLCIRRRDGAADLRDWRHFQQIKNEICGEEREGIEIYPREGRKVDTSNKWHIFVLPEGESFEALGWQERDVQYEERKNVPGLRQRSL